VAFYYLCLAVLLVTFGIMYRIWHSRIGNLIRAVRSSEKLANAFGISAFKYRMIAWLLGCFFAGITGGLTASLIGFTNPNEFLVVKGMYPLIHVIIGGISNPFGPLIGTGFMMIISTIAKDIIGIPYWGEPLMYGLVLLIVLVGLRISIWEFLTGR
jgi:branched-chain amino acid transport system permease protein